MNKKTNIKFKVEEEMNDEEKHRITLLFYLSFSNFKEEKKRFFILGSAIVTFLFEKPSQYGFENILFFHDTFIQMKINQN